MYLETDGMVKSWIVFGVFKSRVYIIFPFLYSEGANWIMDTGIVQSMAALQHMQNYNA